MAPSTIFIMVFVWVLSICNAQTSCITSDIEFEALKAVLQALNPKEKWDFFSSTDLCTKLNITDNTTVTLSGVICDQHCRITTLAYNNQGLDGYISPAIGNLTYLQTLNFEQNILNGTIPPQIGKLTNLQNMTIRRNKLSGGIPREIGNLVSLAGLRLESNDFTGSIPKELGSLRNLRELDIGACGLAGEIPLELANLTSLRIWNGYGNNFNGSVPDIFANMVNLRQLRLYGNNFEGPLPSSLGNLKNLEILNMGDISTNGEIPATLANLTTLKKISLRNCQLTGEIPSSLQRLVNLTYLDLSFNNLSGKIPTALGSLSKLEALFLGSNKLTGELPQLGDLPNLQQFDASYNQLSGSLPTWLNKQGLEISLIWNFLNTTNARGRLLATEFNCLDDKPNCTRIALGESNVKFNINCGGENVTLSNTAYDNDTGDGNITFAKSSSGKWAVSTISYVSSFQARIETSSQESAINSNIANQQLYRTARASPGSLRYYGLNMKNGSYNVTLHFAEIYLTPYNEKDWKSTGKRIFDIYIQGNKVFHNYNIIARAGGLAYTAVVETIETLVTNGVLEIHLQWAGKGTCCTPNENTYGPLISAIDVLPLGVDTSSNSKSNINGKLVASIVSSIILVLFVGISLWLWHKKKKERLLSSTLMGEEFRSMRNKPTLYTYNTLKIATNDFHPTNKLGQGSFGAVYKGILKDNIVVAIKKLSLQSTRKEFVNEVAVISSVQHRNLVKLLGCCFEGDERILVLEFMEKNNLHQALFGPLELRIFFDWPTRVNICLGVARGLAYLHEEASPRIIHRDIKLTNILLDKNLNPKIGDFGLAKLFKEEQTHISTRVAGTMGYLAPEYAMRGQLTEKADVYSFGILILELISGRNNMDRSLPPNEIYILDHVWHLLEIDCLLDIVDKQVRNECSEDEAKKIAKLALFCTQTSLNQRPTMTQVVTILSKPCEIDVSGLQQEEYGDYLPTLTLFSGQECNSNSESQLSSMSMPSYRLSLIR